MVSGWGTFWSARNAYATMGIERYPSYWLATDTIWISLCLWSRLSPDRPNGWVVSPLSEYGFGKCFFQRVWKGSWSRCSCYYDLGPGRLSYLQKCSTAWQCHPNPFAAVLAATESNWKALAVSSKTLLVKSHVCRLRCLASHRNRCVAENLLR